MIILWSCFIFFFSFLFAFNTLSFLLISDFLGLLGCILCLFSRFLGIFQCLVSCILSFGLIGFLQLASSTVINGLLGSSSSFGSFTLGCLSLESLLLCQGFSLFSFFRLGLIVVSSGFSLLLCSIGFSFLSSLLCGFCLLFKLCFFIGFFPCFFSLFSCLFLSILEGFLSCFFSSLSILLFIITSSYLDSLWLG